MSWKLFGVLLLAKFCGEQFSNTDNSPLAAHMWREVQKILSIVWARTQEKRNKRAHSSRLILQYLWADDYIII